MLTVYVTESEQGCDVSAIEGSAVRRLVGNLKGTPALDYSDPLNFYLEEYLDSPVGAFADRAKEIAECAIPGWGRSLVDAIFNGDDSLKDLAADVGERLANGLPVLLVIEGEAGSALHTLPWELVVPILEPEKTTGELTVVRSLGQFVPTQTGRLGTRMLIVIARPGGASDVPHQIIAQQVVAWNKFHGSILDIDVLRPPSFQRLQELLEQRSNEKQPYDIVHFDGHGEFDNDGGTLVFESQEGGGAERVAGSRVASALAKYGVNLVLLNACQSGAASDSEEVAHGVATEILNAGVSAVVAMTHDVQVRAAELFVSVFYKSLLSGERLSSCMTKARRKLRRDQLRPSIIGSVPLQDWMVPVLYAKRDLEPSISKSKRVEASEESETNHVRVVGRDDGFLELERILDTNVLVHLHGTAGIGKTTLAESFAEWIRETGGLGAEKAGEHGWARLKGWPPDVEAELPERPIAILDDVEHVSVLSDGHEASQFANELLEFVRHVALLDGRTVLVTRSALPWLEVPRLAVYRLDKPGSTMLASSFEGNESRTTKREKEGRIELSRLLAGHPGAISTVWPLLQRESASTLAASLRGEDVLDPESIQPDSRTLAALHGSVELLHKSLTPYFMIVALSLGVVDALTIRICMLRLGAADSPSEANDQAIALLRAAWAAGAGMPANAFPEQEATDLDLLLQPMRLHPQLAVAFSELEGPNGERAEVWKQTVLESMAMAHVDLSRLVLRDIEQNEYRKMIFGAFRLQRDALARSVGSLMQLDQIEAASWLVAFLSRVDRETESADRSDRNWVETILLRMGEDPSRLDQSGFRAWVGTYGNEAIQLLNSGERDKAAQMLERLRTLLKDRIAEMPAALTLVYRMLGQASAMGMYERDAELALDWYAKALALAKQYDNKVEVASALHDRALTLTGLNRFEEAETDALDAADVRDEINDHGGVAHSYRLLSSIYRGVGRFEEAQEYSELAAIKAARDDDPVAEGKALMSLVKATFFRGKNTRESLTKAIRCFLRGEDKRELARACLSFANVEQMDGQLDEAEKWVAHARQAADESRDVGLIQQVEKAEIALRHNRDLEDKGSE